MHLLSYNIQLNQNVCIIIVTFCTTEKFFLKYKPKFTMLTDLYPVYSPNVQYVRKISNFSTEISRGTVEGAAIPA